MFISNFILAGTSIFSLIISFLITIKGLRSKFPLGFLGGSFFMFAIYFTTRVLWYEYEMILDYPHFLRSISPLMFLPAPLFYLGIRDLIKGEKTWRKMDWIHFLPAFLHLIELIPLYSLSAEEKRLIAIEVIRAKAGMVNFPGGLISGMVTDIIRLILMFAYFGYSWLLIFRSELLKSERTILRFFDSWIRTSLIFFGLLQTIFLIQYLLNLQYLITGVQFLRIHGINVLLLFIIITSYTFFLINKMRLSLDFVDFSLEDSEFEGYDSKKKDKISNKVSRHAALASIYATLTEDDLEYLKIKLESLLERNEIFLQHNLLVTEFAKKMEIPVRQVPLLLYAVYGKTFNDLINDYRVAYAKVKIDNGYLNSYTLESLGNECGFSSRTTFFNAFKKEFKISPSEYWKNQSSTSQDLNTI